ncbi:MAG: M20/M25/M40 family metallo-hydrolase [Verrucomicrobia bacterium]|nr:M20/M25/M40 family metallo-hydrolase [Verrucomicrobiota bacterium]
MTSPRFGWLCVLCFASAVAGARPAAGTAASPDFAAAREEMVRILTGFIKVDTSNPPGNETKGAEYLKAFLDREGLASEILELEKGRGSLVARLKGNGKKKPLLLMGHTDVVGVERDKWTVEPFAGLIKDGFVYGRGASDDKGMTSACLEIFLLLHRLKVPLDRDVIFLAEAGEEGTTHVGIDFLVAKHWDKIACEFALNEGGRIYESKGRVQYVGVATAEKVPRPILIAVKGSSGHGSRPRPDNAITHLAMAVAKIGTWQPPMRLNSTTRTFFERLAAISEPADAFLFTHLEDPVLGPIVQEKLRLTQHGYNAMLRTTLTPTIMKGGFRINVIPGDALAMVDCRALPDEDMDTFIGQLRKLIDDPQIEVLPPERGRPATEPSRHDTAMFAAIERAQRKHFAGAVTIPMMLTGATDSAQLRAKGVQAYGLGSVSTDEESTRVHGNDERISIAGLGRFLEFLWTAVTDVAAAK